MRRPRIIILVSALALAACDGEAPDTDRPDAPALDALDALTSEIEITLSGTAEPSAAIDVTGGDGDASGTADADGNFEVLVRLDADAANTLEVTQTVGGLTSDATTVTITHDGTGPDTPTVEPVVSPTRRSTQTLRGDTVAGATILVRGGAEEAEAVADVMGRYAVTVALLTSEDDAVDNALSVVALDPLGNESAPADVTIRFDPSIPLEAPALDDFPSATNQSTVTLTGEAEAGAEIQVSGGATETSVTVGADNRFSLEVGLRPNQRNTILLFAVAGAETSIGATAIIVHDDIAPAAANLDPQASPTGAETVNVGGVAEPGTMVVIAGGTAGVSGAVDETGRFGVDVPLNADAENTLSVTVVDAAANMSPVVELSITHDSSLEDPILVDAVVSPTSDATVTLTGSAAAEIAIEVTGGAATATTTSDASGAFSVEVTLQANARNELRVTRPGSGVDTIVIVEHDDTAPNAPELNQIASPTANTRVTVSGMTEGLARLEVTGGVAAVMGNALEDGRFAIEVQIPTDTTTTLTVVAADRAGNSSAPAMVAVAHSSSVPAAPIVDMPNPPPTNEPTHTIVGRVTEPGAGIGIRVLLDGSEVATGTTHATTGAFSVTVPLTANTVSSLSVVSIEGEITSSPAIVTITHDDIPPGAPDASRITGTAGLCLGVAAGGTIAGSMGSVEPNARVTALNVTRTVTANGAATDLGSFSFGLTQCVGNIIRITATDAAGNTSAPTEITTD